MNMVIKFGGIRRRILYICNMHLRLQQSPIFERTAESDQQYEKRWQWKTNLCTTFWKSSSLIHPQGLRICHQTAWRIVGAQFHTVFLGSGKVENVKVKMGCDIPLNKFDTQSWHMSEGLRMGLKVHFVLSKIWLNESLRTVINGKSHN